MTCIFVTMNMGKVLDLMRVEEYLNFGNDRITLRYYY
jgi:hypothetical protein